MAQEAFIVNDRYEAPKVCGWCGDPAVDVVVLEPDRFRWEVKLGKRIKVLRKRAIVAGVCEGHRNILERQPGKEGKEHHIV